jgi:hypothetical protein
MELLKSLKFLTAVCFAVEALVLQFAPDFALTSGTLLLAVVAVLNLFGVKPELMAKREAALKAKALTKGKK